MGEETIFVIRGVILIGVVLASFFLLGGGFFFVAREYRLIRNFDQMTEFIKATKEASLSADLTKKTITLGRTRPGLIMMGIGAILLLACVFRPATLDTKNGIKTVLGNQNPIEDFANGSPLEASTNQVAEDFLREFVRAVKIKEYDHALKEISMAANSHASTNAAALVSNILFSISNDLHQVRHTVPIIDNLRH